MFTIQAAIFQVERDFFHWKIRVGDALRDQWRRIIPITAGQNALFIFDFQRPDLERLLANLDAQLITNNGINQPVTTGLFCEALHAARMIDIACEGGRSIEVMTHWRIPPSSAAGL